MNELRAIHRSEEMLHSWLVQAEAIAFEVGVVSEIPQVSSRQTFRNNVEFSSVEEYYERSIVLPLLDRLVQQMSDRFGTTQTVTANIIHLAPSAIQFMPINL